MIGGIILTISLSLWLTPYPCTDPHTYTPAQQYWCSGVLVPYDFVDDCVECWETKPQIVEDLQDCEQKLTQQSTHSLPDTAIIILGSVSIFLLGIITGAGVVYTIQTQ